MITNDKEVVLRCREEADEAQLGGVDVLELVDAMVAEASLPPAAKPPSLTPGVLINVRPKFRNGG